MTHAEMNELYELYALGVLEPELTAEIEAHLREKCPVCIEQVQEASKLVAALSGVAEPLIPPRNLRARVLAGVRPPKRYANWMFAVAGLSTAAAALLIFSFWSAVQASQAREQLNLVSQERNRLRAAAGDLSRSQDQAVRLRDQLATTTNERDRLRAAAEDLARSQEEAVRLRDQLAALTSERDRLLAVSQTLSNTQAEAMKLREQLAALTNERDQLRVAIEKSQDETARFRTQLAALTTEHDRLQAAVERSQQEAAGLREQSATARSNQDQLRAAIDLLTEPRTRTINFGHPESVPHGHVFLSPEGLVLVGSQSPPVPGDKTLELWLMPAQGAPQPAGLFRPNASGQFIYTKSAPIDTSQIKAIAISIEPRQGSSAPTTKPFLVVPIG